MIVLITCKDDKGQVIVSHGVDSLTMKNVCLPCEPLGYFKIHCKAKFLETLGEWVIESE